MIKRCPHKLHFMMILMVFAFIAPNAVEPQSAKANDDTAIKHSFIAFGGQTRIIDEDGKVSWRYKRGTRDGYVQDDGRIVAAVNKGGEFPGGAAIEITRDDQGGYTEHVIWKGTQSEINSVQPVTTPAGTRYVLTEAGPNPRLLEVDRDGKIHVEIKLACQLKNHHMQTRMARKLADGTYLAPHLFDFAVKHYDAKGNVLKAFDTTVKGDPQRKIHTWPFTAIRLPDGSTHVNLTHSNRVVRFDKDGKIIWQLTNDDLPGKWLADPCGGHVLPNGNTVITSYGQRNKALPKMIEVTPDKKVVWKWGEGEGGGVHHFQILTTNGKSVEGTPMK